MNPRVFREYDIRGVADRDFSDEFVAALGKAFGTLIYRHKQGGSGRPQVAIGRDCRLTSPRLAKHLIAGIASVGVDVVFVGVVPTPVLYFAAHHWPLDGAIIITGSHNPPQDNGFKIMQGTSSLHGEEIQNLRRMIEDRDFHEPAGGPGSQTERDVITPYLEHAVSQIRLGERRFKVVVDAGNGAGGPAAVALYRKLGFEVIDLYCDMDGSFPNHHPDPSVVANVAELCERVRSEKAAIGIALDGDADRIGAVDSDGRIIWGDQLMILFGRAILEENPGATFIGEVKCSQALYDELEKAGGHPIMWRVGHSLIKAKMRESGALLGGEMSGHIFFKHRYLGFDDALYAGARLLELLSRSDKTSAQLYDTLPRMLNTPEMRLACPDDIKFDVVAKATERLRSRADVQSVVDVDGARANFGDGWGLLRASNTQPVLVVRCEAATAERLAEIQSIIETEAARARSDVAG